LSETSMEFYQSTRLYIRDEHALYNHCCESLYSNKGALQLGPCVEVILQTSRAIGTVAVGTRTRRRPDHGHRHTARGAAWARTGEQPSLHRRVPVWPADHFRNMETSVRYLHIRGANEGVPRWLKRGTIRRLGASCHSEAINSAGIFIL
jgi:hypothetical protein